MKIDIHTVGRRKTAVARIFLRTPEGKEGKFIINGREATAYLNDPVLWLKVKKPFQVLGLSPSDFDIKVNAYGGGVNGQAEAIRLALARALEKLNPEYHTPLKKEKLLTVDSRQVERKKYGLKKARKAEQYSKR
jgi:small subunit ribosomal protein S9